ncbi:MAG: phosphodiester glycosidase family protein [Clostridia bacterium]|nr:phosphodiester glycosidase family protein [Clostridia bacterium]
MLKKCLVLLFALMLVCSCAMAEGIHGYDKKQGGYSYVQFGTFPSDAAGNEAPILWRVLSVENDEAFLLAEYIIDVHYVHLDTKAYYDMKWEESDLYAYLQTDFMNRAFTDAEQQVLLQRTEDGALVTLPQIDDIRNKTYGFADNKSRECKGTDYAKSIGLYLYGDKNSPWVSRNKSKDRPMQQRRVMDEGKLGTVPCGNVDLGIRPCVYVDLSQLVIVSGDGTKDHPFLLLSAAAPRATATPEPTAAPEVKAPEAQPEGETKVVITPQQTVAPASATTSLSSSSGDLSSLIDQYMKNKGGATVAPVTVTTIDTPEASSVTFTDEDGTVITYVAPEKADAPQENTPVQITEPEDTQEAAPVQPETDKTEETPAASGDGFTAGSDPAYIHPSFTGLNEKGFLPEGEAEFVLTDEENGLWLYASQTLRIQIERKTGTNSKKQPLRWYEARIFTSDESEMFDLYPWDEENYTNHYKLTLADEIALKHKLVFAINSDYFIYREARQHDKDVNYVYPKGLIIRDKEVFYDLPRKSTSTVYPPLDVLAFYPDGDMKVFLNGSITADEMLKTGATDTLSFGPILVENGEVSTRSTEFGSTPNPRTAIGMVEKGHYVCLMVESRISESKGESCVWMGKMMEQLGCEVALNLDGGATSTMIFMGKQINKSGNYGDITNRKQNELIGIGISENVGK